jgi:mediator of RNA polymerase II transcription subunit 12
VRTLSRPLASPGAIQRPSPHRAVSQQYATSSPLRRTTNDGPIDLTLDTTEVVGNRMIPRSRLNLEIGHDITGGEIVESPRDSDISSQVAASARVPRNRPKLHSDFNVSIRPAQEAGAIKPFPPRPGQHAPPTSTSNPSQTQTQTVKKDARPKPFTLEIPSAAPSFPANGMALPTTFDI